MAGLAGKVRGVFCESFFQVFRGAPRRARPRHREKRKVATHAKFAAPLENQREHFPRACAPILDATAARNKETRDPACAAPAGLFCRGGRAWSSPWCTPGDVANVERHRGRCSRLASRESASSQIPGGRAKLETRTGRNARSDS